jgi:hypothetical protein
LLIDPALGSHFYGADATLQARRRGLAAVVVDALRLHNARSAGLPPEFGPGAAAKWVAELPVDHAGRLMPF